MSPAPSVMERWLAFQVELHEWQDGCTAELDAAGLGVQVASPVSGANSTSESRPRPRVDVVMEFREPPADVVNTRTLLPHDGGQPASGRGTAAE